MSARSYSGHSDHISQRRLWFGFSAAAAAWAIHGFTSVFISWQACQDGDGDCGGISAAGVRLLLALVTLGLLTVAVAALLTSFRNWRRLSEHRRLTHAEGRGREEFMALGGVFAGAAFVLGILWAGVPLILIDVCMRAR